MSRNSQLIKFLNFFFSLQLFPDQMSLLNKAQAHFQNPLKNLQSAYKTILVRYIKQTDGFWYHNEGVNAARQGIGGF